jgi:hypothetical protein
MYEGPKLSRSATGRSIPRSRGGRLVWIVVLLAPAAGAAYYFATHPEVTPQESLARVAEGWQGLRDEIRRRTGRPSVEPAGRRVADGRRPQTEPDSESSGDEAAEPRKPAMSVTSLAEPEIPAEKRTVLFLKNGEQVSGEVISETADTLVLQWGHGQAEFNRSEILQITRPSPAAPDVVESLDTPGFAAREVTVHLKNGGVVTGELAQELPDRIVLKFDFGEVAFHRTEIDRIDGGPAPAGP